VDTRTGRSGASHRTTLYKEGVPVRTTVREYGPSGNIRREAVEEEGVLLEESAFDDGGRPLAVRRLLADGVVEETSYVYIDGRLLSRKTSAGGKILETMDYLYAPDGRLVSAKASGGAFHGSGRTASGVSSMWRKGPDGLELRLYDASGRLAAVRVYDGAALKSEETRTWAGDVLERSGFVTSDGTKTSTTYAVAGAAAGNILSVTVERGGATASSDRRSYDDAGRLLRMETETGGRRAVTEYTYDDEGNLSVEKRFLDPGQMLVIRRRIQHRQGRGDLPRGCPDSPCIVP
jgi:YD repeat-containing protein